MKKLNKLKLNEIAADNLSNKEMKEIKGGEYRGCTCSCYWAGSGGGSSTKDNCVANYYIGATGGESKEGENRSICSTN